MDPIGILEKRVEALESLVFAKDSNHETLKNQTVIDLLLQTQTMISSALSCREVITNLLQRMEQINDYLDPNYGDNELDLEDKKKYLIEIYPKIRETAQLVNNISSLSTFMDSPNIMMFLEYFDKLDELSLANLQIYEEDREVTQNVLKFLQQYSELTSSLQVLLAQFHIALESVENAMQPKPQIED